MRIEKFSLIDLKNYRENSFFIFTLSYLFESFKNDPPSITHGEIIDFNSLPKCSLLKYL